MTPQERALVQDLFDRLAALENAPRDRDAEREIGNGLRRAPNALYALVQTVLVQDEALKSADARIQELEAALEPRPEGQERGFLDEMRDSLFGRREDARGSVPSVPPRGRQSPWTPMSGAPYPGGAGEAQERSRIGSFLGAAAASAAGVVGGALLLNSIRSAFGSHSQGPFQGALDPGGGEKAPWGGGGGGDLARQAGLDDVGRSGYSGAGDGGGRAAGAYDPIAGAQDESAGNDADYGAGYEDEMNGFEDFDGDFSDGESEA